MSYLLIAAVALAASGLTFFSGFGLGTLLLPAFALFFPVQVAIAATAVVHLANNLFKFGLVGRHAAWRVVARFGVPALVAAALGGLLLGALADLAPLAIYELWGRTHAVTPIKLVVAALILLFAVLELRPELEQGLRLAAWPLPVGGVLSGFFGGLSGHQGALRSAFLLRAGLGKEAFIATGIACAVLIDVARLAVYSRQMVAQARGALDAGALELVAVATVAAFAGAVLGRRLLPKVTMRAIRSIVAALLAAVGLGLAAGLL